MLKIHKITTNDGSADDNTLSVPEGKKWLIKEILFEVVTNEDWDWNNNNTYPHPIERLNLQRYGRGYTVFRHNVLGDDDVITPSIGGVVTKLREIKPNTTSGERSNFIFSWSGDFYLTSPINSSLESGFFIREESLNQSGAVYTITIIYFEFDNN